MIKLSTVTDPKLIHVTLAQYIQNMVTFSTAIIISNTISVCKAFFFCHCFLLQK